MREDFPDAGVEPQQPRRSVELLEHRVENAAACFHVAPYARQPHRAVRKSKQDQATVTGGKSSGSECIAEPRRVRTAEACGGRRWRAHVHVARAGLRY